MLDKSKINADMFARFAAISPPLIESPAVVPACSDSALERLRGVKLDNTPPSEL
jgi:hypothetical protein